MAAGRKGDGERGQGCHFGCLLSHIMSTEMAFRAFDLLFKIRCLSFHGLEIVFFNNFEDLATLTVTTLLLLLWSTSPDPDSIFFFFCKKKMKHL